MKFVDKIKKVTHRATKRRAEHNNRKELVEAKKFVQQQARKGEGSCSILCQHRETGEYFERNGFFVEYRDVDFDWVQGIEITIIWGRE